MPTLTTPYSFYFNGLYFGGEGSPYQILSVDGLESLPGLRVQDDNRGYADGMFSGRDFLAGRIITITFNTFGSGSTSAQENFNTAQQALLPQTSGTTPLYFKLPTSGSAGQFINARVRGLRTTIDPNYTYGWIVSQLELFCPDPKYYNANEQTAQIIYNVNQGRTYNRVYPLTYGGGTAYRTVSVVNNGWATTYPTITLNGPIVDPSFSNMTTGDTLNFTCNLNAPDVLVVDLYNKLVTLNGQPARNLLSSGTWFAAQPGSNLFNVNGTYYQAGVTTVTISWNSAYI